MVHKPGTSDVRCGCMHSNSETGAQSMSAAGRGVLVSVYLELLVWAVAQTETTHHRTLHYLKVIVHNKAKN